jgi:fructose-1,6-bisphosphatase I / sedoheptulose-1,7-bisphosphatase
MMSIAHTTLTQFVIDEHRAAEDSVAELAGAVSDVALACKIMTTTVAKWPLARLGDGGESADSGDGQDGGARRRPEPSAREVLLRAKEWSAHLGNTMWGAADDPFGAVSRRSGRGLMLMFEPIDRWMNLDINVAVGSVFSLARVPGADAVAARDELPHGSQIVCAGYAIYGPSTMLVLATEHGVNGFTLDYEVGEFVLTHPRLTIAEEAQDFAINTSASRYWTPALKRYVDECVSGRAGPRGRDFNMRWNGSLVTELHRTLIRGGVCCYPRDLEGRNDHRCLRLVQDANAVAYIVERAGGRASTGEQRVLELCPHSADQRVGIVFGASVEVELIERYHRESAQGDYTSPLFNSRGLFESEIR